MINYEKNLYELTTGKPVTSMSPFSSPIDEYRVAFEERALPFLIYYAFQDGKIKKHSLTRGEFWDQYSSYWMYLQNCLLPGCKQAQQW